MSSLNTRSSLEDISVNKRVVAGMGKGIKKEFVRKKAWRPKTRTGCMTCRIRRVKCDEAKPNCARCASTGRHCDGYANPAASPSSHVVVYPPPRLPIATAPGLNLNCTKEQEAFHFFKQHTADELSGFFDSSFWQFEILQASHTLPSIRHAIIAMAAMHRKFIMGRRPTVPEDNSDKQLNFAMQQSTLALEALGESAQTLSDSKDLLTTSILFYYLSCFQGHQSAAIEHLRSGLKILRQVYADFDVSKEHLDYHPISLKTLRAMFVTMDVQARGIMSDAVIATWAQQPARDFLLPTSLKTFPQARYYFDTVFGEILTFMQNLDNRPPSAPEEAHRAVEQVRRFQQEFQTLSSTLDDFLAQLSPMTSREDQKSIMAIKLYREQVRVYLRAFGGFREGNLVRKVGWHVDEHDMRILLELATELLQAPSDLSTAPGAGLDDCFPLPLGMESIGEMGVPSCARPVFSSGSGVCAALWQITSRARSPALRRQAIALMMKYPRREGVWDSFVAGRVAWERMMLEETALEGQLGVQSGHLDERNGYIPDCNKIRSIAFHNVGPRLGKVHFRSIKQCELGQQGVTKLISW